MKKNKLQNIFNDLEQTRDELFLELQTSDNKALNFNPEEGKWSIIQIIHHIYKSEQLSIIYIKRAVSKPENIKKSRLFSKIRGFLLSFAMKVDLKFTAPKNVSDVPDYGELINYDLKWSKIRKELQSLIEKTTEEIQNSDIFNHPSIGKMNMKSALNFMQAHFNHHKKQIDKILLINNN